MISFLLVGKGGMATQITAKFPGTCSCGATVSVEDRIDYDPETKTVARCIMCGLKDVRYMGPRKGQRSNAHIDPGQSVGGRLRYNAMSLAGAMRMVARWEAKLAAATDETAKEKATRMLASRQEYLASSQRDVVGQSKNVRPSARDIELAALKIEEEDRRRAAEEAEEAD